MVTSEQMRTAEEIWISQGTSADLLMERAAQGILDRLLCDPLTQNASEVFILAGKGNNGGDGIVLTRLLLEKGWKVRLAIVSGSLNELPQKKLKRLLDCFPDFKVLENLEVLFDFPSSGVVVDALLGIGVKSKPHGEIAMWIQHLNEARWKRFFRTVSIDLPSGLGEGTESVHDAVIADLTMTIGFPKDILIQERYANWVGRLELIPLGIQDPEGEGLDRHLIIPQEMKEWLPRRLSQSHKGSYGRALLIVGSPGMTGAAILAAGGCLRTGAGLTHVSTFTDCLGVLSGQMPPEVMVRDLFSGQLFDEIQQASGIGIGSGLGQSQEASSAVSYLLDHVQCPVVFDADALNLLSRNPSWESLIPENSILTPHPGEMKRLIQKEGEEIDRDELLSSAIDYAQGHRVILVLKGVRTAVISPEGTVYFNSSGNPGLAKGGSGDVLMGMIVALLSQGLSSRQSALLGVWLHGRAGDEALRKRWVEESVVASDVIESISDAFLALRRM